MAPDNHRPKKSDEKAQRRMLEARQARKRQNIAVNQGSQKQAEHHDGRPAQKENYR